MNKNFQKIVKECLSHVRYDEHFADDFKERHDLCDINYAFGQIHFPDDEDIKSG